MIKIFEKNVNLLLTDLYKYIKEEIDFIANNKILEFQKKQFDRNYYIKTFLHRALPIPLPEVYYPLSVRTQTYEDKDLFTIKNINQLFSETKYATIIGTGGGGKSTLIKFLILSSIKENYKIPILIELRYLLDNNISIIDYLLKNVLELGNFSNNLRIIDRLLSSGKFIIFLDGYDEINSNIKSRISKEINDLVLKYNENNYIITSRPNSNIELLPLFHNFFLAELTNEDVYDFIKLQLQNKESNKELAKKIIDSIKTYESDTISFLRNPLLLSMYILTFQSYSKIPQKKSTLYFQVFETLFDTHDGLSKLSYEREMISNLDKESIINILSRFSFLFFFENKTNFHINSIEEKLNLIKRKEITFSNNKLIKDLESAICILNKNSEVEYSFTHKSFQEYFASLYISKIPVQHKEVIYSKIIDKFFFNKVVDVEINLNEFYILLKELDPYYYFKDFILVILNKFNRDVTTAIITNKINMKLVNNILLFLTKSETIKQTISIDFINIEKTKLLNELNEEINFGLADDAYYLYERLENILLDYLKSFEQDLSNLIKEVEEKISFFDSKDDDIINSI